MTNSIIQFYNVQILLILFIFNISILNAAPTENLDILILHNNDMHARFDQTGKRSDKCSENDIKDNKCYGGFARVSYLVKKYRDEAGSGGIPVLFLNAGDTYTGTSWFSLFKENITADFLNEIQPDAISLGNHEFDENVEGLVPFLNYAKFPVLVSNLDMSKTPDLANTKSLKNSHIFDIQGYKIGVIGYLTPETKSITPPNEVIFLDEIESINKESAKLKKEGVNIIIALGHSGFLTDKNIASKCPDVNFVIGGHTNTFLYNGEKPDLEDIIGPYPVVVQNNEKKVPVVQAYAFTKYLGYIKLKFDTKGNLIKWEGQPILLNGSIPQDEQVLALLNKYRPKISELQKEIVAKSRVLLDGRTCRFQECNLGNLITDSFVFEYANTYNKTKYWTDAPIAFQQGGGIRASIDTSETNGDISKLDINSVLPFDNLMLTTTVSGKIIKEALEFSVRRYSKEVENGEFLQMSGVHVIYNLTEPSGNRVKTVELLCGLCDIPIYEQLDEKKNYKIILTLFLLLGGDGFDMFKTTDYDTIKGKDIELFTNYIQRLKIVYPTVEKRIVIYGTPQLEKNTATRNLHQISSGINIIYVLVVYFLL